MELATTLQRFERVAIETALFMANGTVPVAAKLLGLKRTTLVEKCKRMGIDVPLGRKKITYKKKKKVEV